MKKSNAVSIETSGGVLSFCFLKDGKINNGFHQSVSLKHEQVFWKEFPKRLKKTGLSLKDLDFIAVTRGPGRFTGIRFGMAVAMTWGKVFNIPLFAPTSMDLIQFQASHSAKLAQGEPLLVPRSDSLLLYALEEPKKDWYPATRPPQPLYLKESWK